ncbi:MAG: fibronectin type III domain-containing protein, partial [bacterium]
ANYVYNEKYLIGSGTSMASPFIVGAAALVLANNPVLNQEDVRKKLREGADDLGVAGFDSTYGAGRLNLANILKSAESTEKIFPEIKLPKDNEIISQTFYIVGSVMGDNSSIDSWQIYYEKDGSNNLEKATGNNCYGKNQFPFFSCQIDTKGWENGKIYNIELVVSSGSDSIFNKKRIIFIGLEPPMNLTANGTNPSPRQDNSEFIINWKYPSAYYNRIWYKLGSAPLSNEDGISTTSKPFIIKATAAGGQDLYVWLENFKKERNYKNYSKVPLNYGLSYRVNPPFNVESNVENKNIVISWTQSEKGTYPIIGYYVYKSLSGDFQKDGAVSSQLVNDTNYEFEDLDEGVMYYFAVQAVDSHGNKSEFSLPVSASISSASTLKDLIIDKIKERFQQWRQNMVTSS